MRRLPLAAALLFTSFLCLGCGRQDVAVSLAKRGPVLLNATLLPETLDFRGGSTTVTVAVESERGVRSVLAQITPLDVVGGTTRYYPLTLNAAGLYQTSIPVTSNSQFGGMAVRYRIVVTAEDNDRTASNAVELLLRVLAADGSVPITP